MKLGYCKDCKYWEKVSITTPEGTTSHHECQGVEMTLGVSDSVSDNEFAVLNHGDLSSVGLRTGPMFGCIHFTQKVDAGSAGKMR
jgi:hypothetical protein